MYIADVLVPIIKRELNIDDVMDSDIDQIVSDIITLYGISETGASAQEQLFVKYHAISELYRLIASRRADNVDSTFSTIGFQMQDQFRNWLTLAKEAEARAEKIGAQIGIGQEHLFGSITVTAVDRKTPWVDGYAKDV